MMKKLLISVLLCFWLSGFSKPLAGEEEFFNWTEFGAMLKANAPAGELEKAKYIADNVAKELVRQKINPNYSIFTRGEAILKQGEQSLGTCNDLAEVLQDTLRGAGFSDKQMYTVMGSKEGGARLQGGWIFDYNLDHVVCVVVVDGTPYTFDLWVHGGEKGTFADFNNSAWNGLRLENWAEIMKKFDYSTFSLDPETKREYRDQSLENVRKLILKRTGIEIENKGHNQNQAGTTLSGKESSQETLNEFRKLYPAYLQKFHKGNEVQVIANATEDAATKKYRCANKVFCIVKDGPRKGEKYCCASFEALRTVFELKASIPGMKELLSK
jgi:hypothetical protein